MISRFLLCLVLVLPVGCGTAPPPKPRSSPIIYKVRPTIGGHCVQITQDGVTYTYYAPKWAKRRLFLLRSTPVCAAETTQDSQE